MQGKHCLERLKRILEVVKDELCGLEGASRTDAYMSRHLAELEEKQLKVRTALREQKARMQVGSVQCCSLAGVSRSCHPCSMLSFGWAFWTSDSRQLQPP